MSLRKQIWVVLLSYLTRTGFRWAIISILSGFSLMLIGVGCGRLLRVHTGDENPFFFLIMIGGLAIEASMVAALMIFFAHARQQLMGPTTQFVPNTRRANLIVAAGLFFTIVLALSCPGYDDGVSFFGIMLIALFLMTIIAGAVCNPWLIPIPVIAILLMTHNRYVIGFEHDVTQEFNVATMFHDETPLRTAYLTEHEHFVWAQRYALLLTNLLSLIVLERLSRPKRYRTSLKHLARKLSTLFDQDSHGLSSHRHPFIQTRFARIVHRRFAIHDWRAAVFLAGVIAGLTALVCYLAGISNPLVPVVAMIAVLPGALAAIGWRDRWSSYEFETLYPAKHQQFVSELLFVLLLDMIEYWIAGLAAMLLTILAMRSQMLYDPQLWIAISGSFMMQVLWIGGIALAGQRRQTLPFAAGLGIVVLAILLAFDNFRRADSLLYTSHFVAIATVEMFVGFLFLAIATFAWRRRAAA